MNNKILFKNIGIDCNITSMSIITNRNNISIPTPFGQNIIQNIGNAVTIIKISGDVLTDSSRKDLESMEELLYSSESGILKIPNRKDMKVFFVALSKKESNKDGSISYSLEFLKDTSN